MSGMVSRLCGGQRAHDRRQHETCARTSRIAKKYSSSIAARKFLADLTPTKKSIVVDRARPICHNVKKPVFWVTYELGVNPCDIPCDSLILLITRRCNNAYLSTAPTIPGIWEILKKSRCSDWPSSGNLTKSVECRQITTVTWWTTRLILGYLRIANNFEKATSGIKT